MDRHALLSLTAYSCVSNGYNEECWSARLEIIKRSLVQTSPESLYYMSLSNA